MAAPPSSMDPSAVRSHLLAKPGAEPSFPFGPDVEVFKVIKMFALMPVSADPPRVNLKCDPEQAIALRAQYPGAVLPGYHMSKTHWNTVLLDGTVPDDELIWMIDHSYALIVKSLKKADREALLAQ